MRFFIIAAVAAAGMSFMPVDSAQARGKCVMASAKGFGVGKEMAGQMAKDNLKMGLASKKWKARGKVKVKCMNAFPLDECKASQKACG